LSYARGRRAERATDTRSVPSLTLISVRLARHPGTRLGPAHGTGTIWPKDAPAIVATLLAVSVAVAISITVPFCCGRRPDREPGELLCCRHPTSARY
jgi:hypothetical protein